jgi:HEAT repeat protein
MGLFGPPNIEKMKAKKNVKGLMKALCYKRDWLIRQTAAEALGEIGDSCAVEPLIDALRDGEGNVRKAAAKALGKIGDSCAVLPLITSIKDTDGQVRKSATQALINLGEPAVKALVAALSDDSYRLHAAEALINIGKPTVKPLIAALIDKNKEVRFIAAKSLGTIGDPRAIEPLTAAIKDSDRRVRLEAIWALSRHGESSAVDPLVTALKDEDEYVCKIAAEALEKLGWNPEGEAGAWYWIAKREWEILGNLGSMAVEPLITVLWDDGIDWSNRESAAQTLGSIGIQVVEPLIIALTTATERWNQGRAKKKGFSNVWLHHDMRPRTLDLCEIVIKKIGKIVFPAGDFFIDGLKNNDKRVRDFTLWAIEQMECSFEENEIGAWYQVLRGNWVKVYALGALSLEPLIHDLTNNNSQGAAEVLVKLYREGTLDQTSKQRILNLREFITKPHADLHNENEKGCFTWHTDEGLGVDFPL